MSLKSGVLFTEHNSVWLATFRELHPQSHVATGYHLGPSPLKGSVSVRFASLWTTVMFLSCWFSALDCHRMCKEMDQMNNTRTTTFQPVVLMEFTNSWFNAVSGCSSCLKNISSTSEAQGIRRSSCHFSALHKTIFLWTVRAPTLNVWFPFYFDTQSEVSVH